MEKVLLTGATGFLGNRLARAFLNKGFTVVAICREGSNYERVVDIKKRITWIEAKDEILEEVFAKNNFGAVVHCATNYCRNEKDYLNAFEANVNLPMRLLKLARENGVKAFINCDTFFSDELEGSWTTGCKVYLNNYVKTKYIFREYVRENIKSLDMIFINMKLFHMYGGEDSDGKFVSFLADSLKRNVPSIELSAGMQGRDWIHVDDVVNAFTLIMDRLNNYDSNCYYEYEVGTGIETSVREFCEKLKEISNSNTILEFGKKKMNDKELMHSVANNEPLKGIGWSQKVSLEEGMKRIICGK